MQGGRQASNRKKMDVHAKRVFEGGPACMKECLMKDGRVGMGDETCSEYE